MKRWLAIIIISFAITITIYPSAVIYPKDTLPDSNDTRLIAYIISQVQENITNLKPLYYGRFFAPQENTLAYSDLFLTSSLITLPFRAIIGSPIVVFNLAFIINSTLSIAISLLLFSYLFKNRWAASLTTLLLTLSGFHLHYYAHLQMYSLWLLLLSIYFYLRFQNENRTLFLHLFFLTVTAQITESIFPAYLIFFTVLTHFLFSPKKNLRKILIISIPYVIFWFILVFPYLKLHYSLPEARRPIRDAAHFSLGLEQVFTLYKSYSLIGIFLLALIPSLQRAKRCGNPRLTPWIITLLFALIMSLGPVVKFLGQTVKIFSLPIPLPYAAFYYLFPGFSGFRTPSRFIILAVIANIILIGYASLPLIKKIRTKTKIILLGIIIALLLYEADLPLKGYPVNINMHPVYQEVTLLPENATILELPIKHWGMIDHEIEPIRALYSLSHKHRRLGGISGFAPNYWVTLVEKINSNGLDEENISTLKNLGITHVIENNKLRPLP